MSVTLPDKTQALIVASLKRYSRENLDQEFDDLQARLFLEFVLKEIAPSVYNAAIADAQGFLRDRLADLEASCYEPEFVFWSKGSAVRRKRD
ncbi:MAG: DUF2164 domain-containing protein [Gemmatimonadales bacterium]